MSTTETTTDWHNTAGDRATILARARGYPYALPDASYCWRNGAVAAFDGALCAGRTAVLAVGSNQSPEQLTRKYGRTAPEPIPVQRCFVQDFDVVYSAHVARYGSVPAMLQRSPGTRVSLFVTWLTDDQLAHMHTTELGAENYYYGRVGDPVLTLDDGTVLPEFHAYISRRGHILHEGDALALAAVKADGRRFPAVDTAEMLVRLHARLRSDVDLEDFILRLVADHDYRRTVVAEIARETGPFDHPYDVVAP